MLKPRLPRGKTKDIYINPAVTMFLRHDTDGTLSLIIQTEVRTGKKSFTMSESGLETLNYWLGNGPDKD